MPGVSETLDWVAALAALDRRRRCDPEAVEATLGVALKSKDDIDAVRGEVLAHAGWTPRRSADAMSAMRWRPCSTTSLVFGRLLRALGLEVHVGRLLDVAEALPHVDIGARDDVYHTCRALLVHRTGGPRRCSIVPSTRSGVCRRDGLAQSRRRAGDGGEPASPLAGRRPAAAHRDAPGCRWRLDHRAAVGRLQTWSDAATLAHKDFAEFTPEEIAAGARRAWTGSSGRPASAGRAAGFAGAGLRVDLRRALATSVRTGGDVFKLPTAPAPYAAAPAGAALRHQRLDGALLARAPAVRARARTPDAVASRRSCSPPA